MRGRRGLCRGGPVCLAFLAGCAGGSALGTGAPGSAGGFLRAGVRAGGGHGEGWPGLRDGTVFVHLGGRRGGRFGVPLLGGGDERLRDRVGGVGIERTRTGMGVGEGQAGRHVVVAALGGTGLLGRTGCGGRAGGGVRCVLDRRRVGVIVLVDVAQVLDAREHELADATTHEAPAQLELVGHDLETGLALRAGGCERHDAILPW